MYELEVWIAAIGYKGERQVPEISRQIVIRVWPVNNAGTYDIEQDFRMPRHEVREMSFIQALVVRVGECWRKSPNGVAFLEGLRIIRPSTLVRSARSDDDMANFQYLTDS